MEQPKLNKPLPKFTPNPLIAGMPEHLKEPANFHRISTAIAQTMQRCKKNHESIADMATCATCSDGMKERRLLLKKLGFKNPAQLRKWYEIHNKIKEKFPLVDWRKENEIRKALEALK